MTSTDSTNDIQNNQDPFVNTSATVDHIEGTQIPISGVSGSIYPNIAPTITNSNALDIDQLLYQIKQDNSTNTPTTIPNTYNQTSYNQGITPKKVLVVAGSILGFFSLAAMGFWIWTIMYPIESQDFLYGGSADIQQASISGDLELADTGGIAISTGVLDVPEQTKNTVDGLFAGSGSIQSGSIEDSQLLDKNDNKVIQDKQNIISSNIDGSDGLLGDISTGLSNPDINEQSQHINNIRTKIELAKISYESSKDLQNPKASKLIVVAIKKFEALLSEVENNQVIINNEIADRINNIQSLVDQAKTMMQAGE